MLRRVAYDIYKCTFLKEKFHIVIQISLWFIREGPVITIQHLFR